MSLDLSACLHWASQLQFEQLPQDVVESAKHQAMSMFAAILHGRHSEQGAMISRAHGAIHPADGSSLSLSSLITDPAKAVFLLSSWSMVHDFDDVMLGGHTGHSSVIVPYVLTLTRGGDGRALLLAQVTANEIAARLNIACALGETRGQMASYLHLIAASIARAKYEGRDTDTMKRVLAFALAAPSKLSLPAFLGGDTKFFCAASAVRTGWEAVDCVDAGLRSNPETLTGSQGFLGTHATAAHSALFEDLGKRWYTKTNSFKAYPACGYITSSIDATLDILAQSEIDPDTIAEVRIEASMFTCGVERLSRAYLDGARSSLATLTFCPSFVIASTLVHGEFSPDNLHGSRLEDPRVWSLAARVRVCHSRRHTRAALFTGIPTGVMLNMAPWRQAGPFLRKFNRTVFGREARFRTAWRDADLALQWLATRRSGLPDFATLRKPLGSTVHVLTRDSRRFSASREIPSGFAGGSSPDQVHRMLRSKYLDAANVCGAQQAKHSLSLLERLESATADDLIRNQFVSREIDP